MILVVLNLTEICNQHNIAFKSRYENVIGFGLSKLYEIIKFEFEIVSKYFLQYVEI